MPAPIAPSNVPPPRVRFGWGARILLGLFLFDMLFRSFAVLLPWEADWIPEFEMQHAPRRWPTRAEMAQLSREGDDVLRDELNGSFVATVDFFNPWPRAAVRRHLTDGTAWAKYSVAWLGSRLDLLENAIGINQEWPMFSPNVSTSTTLTRARLFYADGSEFTVRQHADPVDLTRYSHWNQEKVLDHELKVRKGRNDECFGWCNLLAHRHSRNPAGAALVRIELYRVWIDYVPPHEDPVAFYRRQMELTRDHTSPNASYTYYHYDAATGKGAPVESKADQ
jgi:hypothetical protein